MTWANKEYRKEYYKKMHARRWQELRTYIQQEKDKPCADCGQRFGYWCMDFDHKNPANKIMDVSHATRTRSKKLVQQEIAKCDVICSNCHRTRSFRNKVWQI